MPFGSINRFLTTPVRIIKSSKRHLYLVSYQKPVKRLFRPLRLLGPLRTLGPLGTLRPLGLLRQLRLSVLLRQSGQLKFLNSKIKYINALVFTASR